MATGFFITMEGPEGSGKTTQAQLLFEYLQSRGHDVLWTLEPGGTQTGKQIREILLHGDGRIDPFTELMLFEAARAQHVRELLVPALLRGQVILCDRYADSTLAYQGYGRGINIAMIRALDLLATAGLEPDLTLLLDIEPGAGMARRLQKGKVEVQIGEDGRAHVPDEAQSAEPAEADRIEREEMAFHHRVRDGFLSIAAQNPARFSIVSAARPVEAVRAQICHAVDSLLDRAAETDVARAEKLSAVQANLADGSLMDSLRRLLED